MDGRGSTWASSPGTRTLGRLDRCSARSGKISVVSYALQYDVWQLREGSSARRSKGPGSEMAFRNPERPWHIQRARLFSLTLAGRLLGVRPDPYRSFLGFQQPHQGLEDVRLGDDAYQPAVLHHGQAADLAVLHEVRRRGQIGVRRDRHHVAGHDLLDPHLV